ncbi:MAG: class I SAM-dependent methyltransferase [Proteobacteria bacterium]|nr:class I SAM-dependent methyltransferase [Pseudomonadota bacterium]
MAHRFAFGSNWQNFLETVTGDEILEAVDNLARLVPGATLEGKRFLDIGCGSGLHTLAAIRLGAKSVTAFDIDKKSVQATQKILAEHAPGYPAEVTEKSILRAEANTPAAYDVVYSWGVLHHTGAMWQAIRNAAGMFGSGCAEYVFVR